MASPVILISSCLRDATNGANQACRETWLSVDSGLIPYVFLIGQHSEDYALQPDELLVSTTDDYFSLPLKGVEGRKWAIARGFTHVFQAFTDTYIHLRRLLASGYERHEFTGLVRTYPQEGFPREQDFVCGGAGYWTGPEATRLIAESSPRTPYEDVWVTRLLWDHGIKCHSDWRYTHRGGHGEGDAGHADFGFSNGQLITSHLSLGPGQYESSWLREAHRYRLEAEA